MGGIQNRVDGARKRIESEKDHIKQCLDTMDMRLNAMETQMYATSELLKRSCAANEWFRSLRQAIKPT